MVAKWYALRSKPRKENALYQQTLSRGYNVFYPQIRANPVNPRACRVKPFFPGYMFINMDIGSVGLSTFRWMPYSVGIVCFGGEPSSVPDFLISEISQRTELLNQSAQDTQLPFNHGDQVRIDEGVFEGYEAIFDEGLSGGKRVRVLLELLNGRHVRLELVSTQIKEETRAAEDYSSHNSAKHSIH